MHDNRHKICTLVSDLIDVNWGVWKKKMLESFISRQPVLDEHTATFAYDLMFRGGTEEFFTQDENNNSETNILESDDFHDSLDILSSNKKVFINFTEKLLLEGYWSVLQKEQAIIEIDDSVHPNQDVIDACRTLKSSGYMLALGDFHYSSDWEPVIEIADILKIDIKTSSSKEVEAYATKYAQENIKLLAECVESLQDYYHLRKLGYNYFQGYYFSKPEIIRSERMPTSRITKLRLIHEVNKPDFDFSEAEDILKHDPGLTYKLLSFVNSAAMGLRTEVHGIRQALTLIGQSNLRKWISILAVSAFTDKKPSELMHTVVRRGQFCELLAPQFGFKKGQAQSLFLIGMFSLLDAVIDLPIEKVFTSVPLSDEIRDTILGVETEYKDVLDLAITFEIGDWNKISSIIEKHKLVSADVIRNHIKAIEWATNFSE